MGLFEPCPAGYRHATGARGQILGTEPASLVGQLIETIENGQLGLAEAATRLADRGHPEMASTFSQLSREREGFGAQLRVLVSAADEGVTPTALHPADFTMG